MSLRHIKAKVALDAIKAAFYYEGIAVIELKFYSKDVIDD